jgi:hypothetical protein
MTLGGDVAPLTPAHSDRGARGEGEREGGTEEQAA